MTTTIQPALLNSDSQSVFGAFRNKIINGDFNIWQRGTSFAAPANGAYSADCWRYITSGTGVVTISRNTDVPTVAQAGRLFNYSLDVQVTTADTSMAATDVYQIQQRIEGYNWLPLAQKAFTVSFWMKAKKTGVYCVSVQNSGADRTYVAEITVSAADTWEYKTVSITASPSAGTWDYTTGIGLQLGITLAAGSNYQTTAGAWQSGNYATTSNQVIGTDNTANYIRLCGVQIESGETATSFDARPFGTEL